MKLKKELPLQGGSSFKPPRPNYIHFLSQAFPVPHLINTSVCSRATEECDVEFGPVLMEELDQPTSRGPSKLNYLMIL